MKPQVERLELRDCPSGIGILSCQDGAGGSYQVVLNNSGQSNGLTVYSTACLVHQDASGEVLSSVVINASHQAMFDGLAVDQTGNVYLYAQETGQTHTWESVDGGLSLKNLSVQPEYSGQYDGMGWNPATLLGITAPPPNLQALSPQELAQTVDCSVNGWGATYVSPVAAIAGIDAAYSAWYAANGAAWNAQAPAWAQQTPSDSPATEAAALNTYCQVFTTPSVVPPGVSPLPSAPSQPPALATQQSASQLAADYAMYLSLSQKQPL